MVNSDLIRRLNEQRVTLRAQLAEQYSTLLDNHPRIKELKAQINDLERQIRDEAAKLARSMENDARMAGARVDGLSAGLDQLKQLATSTNGQDVELRALEREAKSQRDLLESYLAKYREATARDSLGAASGDTRIISKAIVSNTPFFPKKMPIVLIATLAMLFISAGFITTGELLAGNVYRADAVAPEPVVVEPVAVAAEPVADVVTVESETPTVAAPPAKRRWFPSFGRAKPVAEAPVMVEPTIAEPVPAPEAASAAVSIDDIAQVMRESGDSAKRIAVVGAADGVGATTTAVALARSLAQEGRVVLIDLSLDRPKLAELTTDPRAPGISDLVHGAASFGQIITRDLDFARSGDRGRAHRVRCGRRPHVRAAGDRRRCAGADLRSCHHRCRSGAAGAGRSRRPACALRIAGDG